MAGAVGSGECIRSTLKRSGPGGSAAAEPGGSNFAGAAVAAVLSSGVIAADTNSDGPSAALCGAPDTGTANGDTAPRRTCVHAPEGSWALWDICQLGSPRDQGGPMSQALPGRQAGQRPAASVTAFGQADGQPGGLIPAGVQLRQPASTAAASPSFKLARIKSGAACPYIAGCIIDRLCCRSRCGSKCRRRSPLRRPADRRAPLQLAGGWSVPRGRPASGGR